MPRPCFPPLAAAVLLLVAHSVKADFFDDARRTFTSDIPHFFQDDVPCAFGGRPTSQTRTSCKPGQRQPAGSPARPRPRRPAGSRW